MKRYVSNYYAIFLLLLMGILGFAMIDCGSSDTPKENSSVGGVGGELSISGTAGSSGVSSGGAGGYPIDEPTKTTADKKIFITLRNFVSPSATAKGVYTIVSDFCVENIIESTQKPDKKEESCKSYQINGCHVIRCEPGQNFVPIKENDYAVQNYDCSSTYAPEEGIIKIIYPNRSVSLKRTNGFGENQNQSGFVAFQSGEVLSFKSEPSNDDMPRFEETLTVPNFLNELTFPFSSFAYGTTPDYYPVSSAVEMAFSWSNGKKGDIINIHAESSLSDPIYASVDCSFDTSMQPAVIPYVDVLDQLKINSTTSNYYLQINVQTQRMLFIGNFQIAIQAIYNYGTYQIALP